MAPPNTDGYCVDTTDEQTLMADASTLFDEYNIDLVATRPALEQMLTELGAIDQSTLTNLTAGKLNTVISAINDALAYYQQIEELQSSDGTITSDYEAFSGLVSGVEDSFAAAASILAVLALLSGPVGASAGIAALSLTTTKEIVGALADGLDETLSELRNAFPEETDGCGAEEEQGGGSGESSSPPRTRDNEPRDHQQEDEEHQGSMLQRFLDWIDPLVLDLDGDGVELTELGNPEVFFDYEGDAIRQMSGWVDPDDGILVRDLDGNGQIETSDELFGDASMDAFTDLAGHDSNNDGVIDQSDNVWTDLKVWRDLDQDGETDKGELMSMTTAGVVSISLDRNEVTDLHAGNLVVAEGSYTTTTGQTREAIATFLATDETQTRADLPDDFQINPEVFYLPNLTGTGSQFDLHIAMTMDPQLLSEVQNLAAVAGTISGTEFKTAFEHMVSTWTGVSRADFGSDGAFELAATQAILGNGAPTAQWSSVQTVTYDSLISSLQLRFAAQIGVLAVANAETPVETALALQHPFLALSAFVIDHERGTIEGSLSHAVEMATAYLPRNDRDAAIEQIEKILPMLNALRSEFFDETFQRVHDGSDFEQSVWSVLEATTNDIVLARIAHDYATAAAIENGTGGDDTISVFHDDYVVEYNRDIAVIDAGKGDDTIDHVHETEIFASARAENTAVSSYIYRHGDGNDLIDVTGVGHMVHTVYLPDIAYEDTVLRTGDDGESAVIAFPDGGSISFQGIENDAIRIHFVFEDGRIVTGEDLIAVSGGAENNIINGTDADEVFDGGAGDDVISGMAGSDTYHFFDGGGHDEIDEQAQASGNDILWMRDALMDDVSVTIDGGDVTIKTEGNDSVTIKDQLTPLGLFGSEAAPRVETVRFADAQEIDAAGLQDMAFRQLATSGDDVINGSAVEDRLFLSQGNDLLSGRGGADSYIRESASGDAVIDDLGGTVGDRLVLKDAVRADVGLSRDGNDLVLTFSDGSTITLARQMANGGLSAIEEIEFADGEILSAGEFATLINTTSGGDALLEGTDAAETLTGGLASETLDGRGGDDLLEGGGGSDLYIRRSGEGNDVIRDTGGSSAIETDRVSFEGLSSTDVAFRRKQSGDLEIETLSTGEILTVEGQFTGSTTDGIEEFVFSDVTLRAADLVDAPLSGGDGDDTLTGTGDDDEIVGGRGNDVMDGNGGSDLYVVRAGDGHDLIDDMAAPEDVNVLRLQGVDATTIGVERLTDNVHNDALIRFGENQTVTLAGQFSPTDDTRGVQSIVFDDGTVLDRETLKSMARVVGTEIDDELSGSVEDDIIFGLAGDDTLSGLAGDDIYRWGVGDGNDVILDSASADMRSANTVEFIGLDRADVAFARDGDNLTATIASGETLTVHDQFGATLGNSVMGVGAMAFADGETLGRADLIEMFPITGTDAGESLTGGAGDDALLAGLGDDVVQGGRGSDIALWRMGDGNDLVFDTGHETTAVDSVKFVDVASDEVSYARGGFAFTDLEIIVSETGERVTLGDHFGGGSGIETIVFADGVAIDTADVANLPYIGTDAGDYIEAGADDDLLIGGLGDDTLLGGAGADTYVHAPGDGGGLIDESYEDFSGGEGEFDFEFEFEDPDAGPGEFILHNSAGDTLDLSGHVIADVTFERGPFGPDDLLIRFNGDGSELTVANQFAGALAGIEHFIFDDGVMTAVDVAGFVAPRDTAGTDDADVLVGDFIAQTFTPGGGDDLIVTGGGADTVVIAPGGGIDHIEGFEGGPFGTVFDLDPTLAADFEAVMAAAAQAGDDVMIDFGDFDILILTDTRMSDLAPENFGFAPSPIVGTDLADALSGTILSDVIEALAGNDVIEARDGDDLVHAGDGDDRVSHVAGDGNDAYHGGDGHDTIVLEGGDATVDLAAESALIGNDVITLTGFEAVVLGDGNDQTIADGHHNVLRLGGGDDVASGGEGDDNLDGEGGNDRLEGGAGDDVIIGGEGDDSAVFSGNLSDYRITETGLGFQVEDLRGEGFDGLDRLHGVENLIFADQTVAIDAAVGDSDLPIIEGTAGRDRLRGTDDAEQIVGLEGNDRLLGRGGDDLLDGGEGRDFLNGGLGDDSMKGGAGDDTYVVDSAGDSVIEMADAGTDTIRAKVSYTLADNVEVLRLVGEDAKDGTGNTLDNLIYGSSADNHLVGNAGDDRMFGRSGDDLLEGGAGADTLRGGFGDDVIVGGAGADNLRGGQGADNYLFAAEDGVARDMVRGFEIGVDSIGLSGLSVTSIADTGMHALITFDNGAEVLLRAVEASDLSLENDFVFV